MKANTTLLSMVVANALILFSGCLYENNLPEDLIEEALTKDSVIIAPPCNYSDTAAVRSYGRTYGSTSYNIDDMFDYTEIKIRFYSSTAYIVFSHWGRYGLRDITDEVIDYGTPGNKTISFGTIDYNSLPDLHAVRGKLYVKVLDSKHISLTWCDVILQDNNKNEYSTIGQQTIAF
ncbi:MAG: hypothetical protein GC181_12425 [Bacteroidetes bacterium]|nr:hypothetical protein [Bacteroidota bacterium]